VPDGRLQRIDEAREVAYIVRRGRTYSAPLSEVDGKARVPTARVSFDVVRRGGSETATNVRLRTGTRTSRRQRRFGDLTGARRPGAKTETIAGKTLGVNVTTQPFRVAKAWLGAMAESDFDGATSLYLPRALLHVPATADADSEAIIGRKAIRAALERSPLAGVDPETAEVRGVDRFVRIDCRCHGRDHTTYLEVDRGNVFEQWIDTEPEVEESHDDRVPIQVIARGQVPEGAKEAAARKVAQVAGHTRQRLRSGRAKLTVVANPAAEQPAMVEASLDFGVSMVRAHSAAETFDEAIDLVVDRLRASIEHRLDRDSLHHDPSGMAALPGSWRHGNLARRETLFFERPTDEREIVRHKSFAPHELTVDEAIWDMSLLSYDFFLFVELETGQDMMLEQSDDGALILHRLVVDVGEPADVTELPTDVSTSAQVPPVLDVSDAIELLDGAGRSRLFFQNRTTGRGNVIYRRYDGHYGLVTPPAD